MATCRGESNHGLRSILEPLQSLILPIFLLFVLEREREREMILRGGFLSVSTVSIPHLGRFRRRGIGSPAAVKAGATTTTTINTTDQLRTQIDQLHSEAEITRSKANSARMRLMRLAEAAENLQQQAAVCIQTGKEDEAKGLLLQKRQVMLALEKSKRRIEVLDKLLSKLSEAISLKESQLIGNVASYSVASTQDTNHPIRIISPKEDDEDSRDGDFDIPELDETEESKEHEVERPPDYQLPANELAGNVSFSVDDKEGPSSYWDFLDHIKEQLEDVETDLLAMLRISTVVSESEEKQKNAQLQLTIELLGDVSSIRRRITSIMKMKTGDSKA